MALWYQSGTRFTRKKAGPLDPAFEQKILFIHKLVLLPLINNDNAIPPEVNAYGLTIVEAVASSASGS
jgi:hypothetical protein